jgi:hypothetical protein
MSWRAVNNHHAVQIVQPATQGNTPMTTFTAKASTAARTSVAIAFAGAVNMVAANSGGGAVGISAGCGGFTGSVAA